MLEGLDKTRADGWQLHLTSQQQKVVDDLLLESDSHGVLARESMVRDTDSWLTVEDCYAAYVEFCTERGWIALAKNKFSSAIADTIARNLGSLRGTTFLTPTESSREDGKVFAAFEKHASKLVHRRPKCPPGRFGQGFRYSVDHRGEPRGPSSTGMVRAKRPAK